MSELRLACYTVVLAQQALLTRLLHLHSPADVIGRELLARVSAGVGPTVIGQNLRTDSKIIYHNSSVDWVLFFADF